MCCFNVRSDIFAINVCISAQMNVSTHTSMRCCISHSRIHCSRCFQCYHASIPECFFSSLQLIHTTHLRTSAEGKKNLLLCVLLHLGSTLCMCVRLYSVCLVYLCAVCTFKPTVCLWICWIADNVNEKSTPMNIWAPKCKRTSTYMNGWVDRWMDECV